MKPLASPDSFYLSAAEGWIELGDYGSAKEKLDYIGHEFRSHPDVLEVCWKVYAHFRQWEDCRTIAAMLTAIVPERPQGWINLACSVCSAADGGVESAKAVLLDAALRFPEESVIRYNLACYAARLGDLKDAAQRLEKAFSSKDAPDLKLKALDDPVLQPLWKGLE